MNTNILIIDFVKNNWILILLSILLLSKIIPPEWAGFWKYKNDKAEDGQPRRLLF